MEQYFFEAFENMERLGPGSEKSTLKAIDGIDRKSAIKILDIGAGVGTHTMLIASEWVILEWKDPLGLRGCGFFQIKDDKIIFQRGYWDKLSFLKQHNLPIE